MRNKRRETTEEEEKLDRYLITYADLITLLLGLFVILYASSQVDASKFKQLSSAIQDYFQKPDTTAAPPGKGVLPGGEGMLPGSIQEDMSAGEFAKALQQELGEVVALGDLSIEHKGETVNLRLSEKLLFAEAQSVIEKGAYPVLDTLAQLLRRTTFAIRVEGHTDSIPIRTFQYESNWHLSVDRALSVGYFLLARGVPDKQFEIVGKGDRLPIAENSTPEGRAQNRRVEIILNRPLADVPTMDGYADSTATNDTNSQ